MPSAAGSLAAVLEVRHRDAGRLGQDGVDLLGGHALGDGDAVGHPGLRVEQQRHGLPRPASACAGCTCRTGCSCPWGSRRAASVNAAVLFTTSASTSALPISVSVAFFGDLTPAPRRCPAVVVGRREEALDLLVAQVDADAEHGEQDEHHEEGDDGPAAACPSSRGRPAGGGACPVRPARPTPGPARQSSRLPPLRVQPSLQDLHRGGLIDDRPVALRLGRHVRPAYGLRPRSTSSRRPDRPAPCPTARSSRPAYARMSMAAAPSAPARRTGKPDHDLHHLMVPTRRTSSAMSCGNGVGAPRPCHGRP